MIYTQNKIVKVSIIMDTVVDQVANTSCMRASEISSSVFWLQKSFCSVNINRKILFTVDKNSNLFSYFITTFRFSAHFV